MGWFDDLLNFSFYQPAEPRFGCCSESHDHLMKSIEKQTEYQQRINTGSETEVALNKLAMIEGIKLQKKEPEKELVPQVFKLDEERMKDMEHAARKVLDANNVKIPGEDVLLERCFQLAPPPPNSIRELISKFPAIKVADWFHHCEGDDEHVGMVDLI